LGNIVAFAIAVMAEDVTRIRMGLGLNRIRPLLAGKIIGLKNKDCGKLAMSNDNQLTALVDLLPCYTFPQKMVKKTVITTSNPK